jgi:hypothetical protein
MKSCCSLVGGYQLFCGVYWLHLEVWSNFNTPDLYVVYITKRMIWIIKEKSEYNTQVNIMGIIVIQKCNFWIALSFWAPLCGQAEERTEMYLQNRFISLKIAVYDLMLTQSLLILSSVLLKLLHDSGNPVRWWVAVIIHAVATHMKKNFKCSLSRYKRITIHTLLIIFALILLCSRCNNLRIWCSQKDGWLSNRIPAWTHDSECSNATHTILNTEISLVAVRFLVSGITDFEGTENRDSSVSIVTSLWSGWPRNLN